MAIRAAQISNEYRRKAEKLDRELGHQDGQGPASRRLRRYAGGQVLDLVLGGYAEGEPGGLDPSGPHGQLPTQETGAGQGLPGLPEGTGHPDPPAQETTFLGGDPG